MVVLKKLFIFMFFSLLAALVFEKLISLQSHTLANTAAWHSVKRLEVMPFGLMGAEEYFSDRHALLGERLNLGAWFGYQDVQYREGIDDFESMNLRVELDADSYLWVYLNCDDMECVALRMSTTPEFNSGIYVIKKNGEITKVAAGEILEDGAHRVGIVADSNRMHLVSIDGHVVHNVKYGSGTSAVLRFRSGEKPAFVSDIEVTGRNKQRLRLNFTAKFQYVRFFGIFGVLLVLALLVGFATRNPNYGFTVIFVFLSLGIILFIFDKFYWSRLYLTREMNPAHEFSSGVVLSFEDWRKNFFKVAEKPQKVQVDITIDDIQIIDRHGNVTAARSIDSVPANSAGALKIAIAGGSQSWGGGASSLSTTWGARLVKELAQKTGRNVVGVNFSICGGKLSNFMQRTDEILKFKPDLMIVNFGFNDEVTPDSHFESQLSEFIDKLAAAKLKVLFSIEAQSIEHLTQETVKAPLIRRLVSKKNYETVSLHDYIAKAETRNSGLLWQDHVHFTDFGQAQAAKFFINTESVKKLTSK